MNESASIKPKHTLDMMLTVDFKPFSTTNYSSFDTKKGE